MCFLKSEYIIYKALKVSRSLLRLFLYLYIMNKHEKFLEFNGKNIVFLNVDGIYWIALKPICEALKIDAFRSIKNLKNDPILGSEWSKQTTQVEKNGKKQHRNVTCLPEKYIYGWLFSLRSDSKELVEYKRTCYELLYNHFHGTITNRKELLLERNRIDDTITNLRKALKEEDDKYIQLENLINKRKVLNSQLNSFDKELIKQPELFNN